MKTIRYCIIFIFFIVGFISLFTLCKVDEAYHHFINAKEPDKFQVTVSITPGSCGANSTEVSVVALDSDETINTNYKRIVKFTLISIEGSECSVDPKTSPPFTEGQLTLSNISITGTPSGNYQLRVNDEKYNDITGTSEEFTIGDTTIDHFEVSGVPDDIFTGATFPITVSATDADGNLFSDFDGSIDLSIGSDFVISPTTERLTGGTKTFYVTVTGTGDYTITATLSDNQPDDVTCLGGLAGGGGGDGGAGGDGTAGETPTPATVTCADLTVSPSTILKGGSFNIQLSISIKDGAGLDYNQSFDGDVDFTLTPISGDIGGLTPTTKAISSTYSNLGPFTITGSGEGTISASVTNIDDNAAISFSHDGSCTAVIIVEQGIGIFGESTTYLIPELEAVFPSKTFFIVTSLNDINTLEPYSALIVSLAGSEWSHVGGSGLTDNAVDTIYEYYNTKGKPIFIAHDCMTTYAMNNLVNPIWGISTKDQIVAVKDENNFVTDPIAFPFNVVSPAASGAGGAVASATVFSEERYDGFKNYAGTNWAVKATFQGVDYALLVYTTAGTKAVIMTDAIYHVYGSQGSPETQWWETNREIIINIIDWLTQ